MFVYTVKSGDSLFTISQKYDISMDSIRSVNGLIRPTIVPGQALLIDTNVYTIQPGDSFYTISQMAYIPLDRLMAANPELHPYFLQPGTKIVLPELPEYTTSVLNYLFITGTQNDSLFINDFAPYTTYYSFFRYYFNVDGSLSSLDDLTAIESAWNSHTAPLMTITNLTAAGFSGVLTSETLNNASSRLNLVNNIFTLVTQRGYAGVNIDFEGTLPEDRTIFTRFLSELGDLLHEAGLLLTIAIPPKTSEDIPWYAGYDYEAIGSIVDFMFIMTYNWHHTASEPGPVAPIRPVRNTIEFALEKMDSRKVILGIPLYGFHWTLPYHLENLATAVSNQDAIDFAMNNNIPIHYSTEDETPYFYYVDEAGQRHVVWFEDTRSIAAKMQLVREYQLQGIGAWQIGFGFSQGPWLLTKFFNIRKVT
ncbi:glycosyl hydrolase family 18 protein [Oceanobacillus senegalensis]|uniref:glycosyl hydrolase family 18 protein n=1 Tax=Oceanobacillus senegalensis TaxID=1936063 RepID=UPI000A30D3AA|nr:glycosyl hydrolase family 18 protein [Oceanobacillus senegalensis]